MSEYKLVPIVPNETMLKAGQNYQHKEYVYDEYNLLKLYHGIYHAMLSASPTTDTINVDRAEYEAMKADAERLNTLMCMSGEYYQESIKHQFVGRLREFIDLHSLEVKQAIDQARKI